MVWATDLESSVKLPAEEKEAGNVEQKQNGPLMFMQSQHKAQGNSIAGLQKGRMWQGRDEGSGWARDLGRRSQLHDRYYYSALRTSRIM